MADDLTRLAADLGRASAAIMVNAEKAVRVTAQNIKDDARKNAKQRDNGHAKRYPTTIDYDVTLTGEGIRGEVGPNIDRYGGQAALGGILEDATGARNRPQRNLERAARANRDDFYRGILKATGGIL